MKTKSLLSRSLFRCPFGRLFSLITSGTLLIAGSLQAATRTVTSLADSGTGSLRNTIAAASSGDTIQFGVTGVITLTSGIQFKKSLTITHSNPATLVIERSSAAGTPAFSLFLVGLDIDYHEATFNGLTIRNARVGGISSSNAGITVTNCVFVNNHVIGTDPQFPAEGAALSCDSAIWHADRPHSASLTVSNCTFTGNSVSGTANARGGAIAVESQHGLEFILSVSNSTFTNNSATGGGAIMCSGMRGATGHATISGTFINNTATDHGGAIFNNNSEVLVGICTFSGNSAAQGGAVYNTGGTGEIVVQHSCFHDNQSGSYGLDVYQASGTCSLINSTLYSGIANRGSVYNSSGLMSAGSCLLNGISTRGELGLSNCIIVQRPIESPTGTVTSHNYNLCEMSGGGFLGKSGDRIYTDPRLDPRGLRNNGGSTKTIALLSDSPAIDRGFRFGINVDQRYQLRPVNHPDVDNAAGGDGSDIGPVEMTDRIQSGNIQVTTLDDHDDGLAGVTDCTLREAIAMANSSPFGASISFAPNLTGTLTLSPALGKLSVSGAVAITGPGARKVEISGNNVLGIFDFHGAGQECFVSGLTLRNGRISNGGGGAAIRNFASLTVRECAFSGNMVIGAAGVQGGADGVSAQGGAVHNGGTMRLERCSFSGNAAMGGAGANHFDFGGGGQGGDGLGGAVYNASTGTLTVECCTIYGNTGEGGKGGDADFFGGNGGMGRGGIFGLGMVTVTSCTISGNNGTGGAGGDGPNQFNDGAAGSSGGALAGTGVMRVRNTVCAANNGGTGPDVNGSFVSGGFNLIGRNNGGTGFTAQGDRSGTNASPLNPQLGLFQNNSTNNGHDNEPTDTMAPLAGSPLLDAGRDFGLLMDQRVARRRHDDPSVSNAAGSDGTDTGAVETNSSFFPGGIVAIEKTGLLVSIKVRGPTNSITRYQLQRSAQLDSGFTDYGPKRQPDSAGYVQFADSDTGGRPRQFYRVVQTFEF